MSQHDHQGAKTHGSSGQASGSDLEVAPFQFEADNPSENQAAGQFGDMDMEFEPFMFDQGESLGISGPASPAIQPLPSAPISSGPAPVAPDMMQSSADPPFAVTGHAVAMPSYLMHTSHDADSADDTPTPAVPVDMPEPTINPLASAPLNSGSLPSQPLSSDSLASSPLSSGSLGSSPISSGSLGSTPLSSGSLKSQPLSSGSLSSGSLSSGSPGSAPLNSGSLASQPLDSGSLVSGSLSTGPMAAQTTTSTGPISSGAGMGRSRGNTGPLGSATPNANSSWSDSSLASIEDFSSVLIAMQAGKRLRHSMPPTDIYTSQGTATATATATAASLEQPPAEVAVQPLATAEHAVTDQEMPDWAAQAVSGMSGMATGAPMQNEQNEQTGAAAASDWAAQQWEQQVTTDSAFGWSAHEQPQAETEQPLPRWSMNPQTESPDATSWTAAQPQPAPAPAPAPVREVAPLPTFGASFAHSEAVQNDLAALRGTPVSEALGGLDPGVADMLRQRSYTISEGTLTGDELQFEGFMFNQGAPTPLPLMPNMDAAALAALPQDMGPVFDPSAYITPEAVEESHEYSDLDSGVLGRPRPDDEPAPRSQSALPFWLQEGSRAAASIPESAQSPAQLASDPAMDMAGNFAADAALGQEEFNDLPPIDPFDFALLDSQVDDEAFGFNTEELAGLMPGGRDPMVVTANLEALADLLGSNSPNLPDSKTLKQAGLGSIEMVMPVVRTPSLAPPTYEPNLDPMLGEGIGEDATTNLPFSPTTSSANQDAQSGPDAASDAGGWMATDTTNLSRHNMAGLTENPATGEMAVADLDVAPFDFEELDLHVDEEAPTGHLNAVNTVSGLNTANLGAQSGNQTGKVGAQSDAPDEVWRAADGDTSLFAGPSTNTQADLEDSDLPTGFLREENRTEPVTVVDVVGEDSAYSPEATSDESEGAHIFRARVARSAWGNYASDNESAPAPAPAPTSGPWEGLAASTETSNSQTADSMVNFEEEYVPKMPAKGDILSSGPLPPLDGFDDLTTWIEQNPHDMGAHMALASAYAQAGDMDTGLRVYRRMLRKPDVSANVLRMIHDELVDLQDQGTGNPRYHQVLGDLLLRQGRRKEAIDEYNKVS
ncbi:MAG: hypothetical protein ABI670_02695 [Chloroflexota bacterium]